MAIQSLYSGPFSGYSGPSRGHLWSSRGFSGPLLMAMRSYSQPVWQQPGGSSSLHGGIRELPPAWHEGPRHGRSRHGAAGATGWQLRCVSGESCPFPRLWGRAGAAPAARGSRGLLPAGPSPRSRHREPWLHRGKTEHAGSSSSFPWHCAQLHPSIWIFPGRV